MERFKKEMEFRNSLDLLKVRSNFSKLAVDFKKDLDHIINRIDKLLKIK